MVTARGVQALCGAANRLRASPWVRAGLLTVVLVFCGYGLAVDWPQVHPAVRRLHWYSRSGWALAIAPLILIGLCPPVLGRLLDSALTLVRWQPLERRPSVRGVARALGWTALGWLLWGLQAWVLVRDITGRGAHVLLLAFGAYAIAWSAGILIVVFPGGIGPRELALVAALAPVMPRGAALVIALISRVVMTTSDLIWGAVGLAIGRWAHRPGTKPGSTDPLRSPQGQAAEPTGSLS